MRDLKFSQIHDIQEKGYSCEDSGRGYYAVECNMPLPLAEEMYYETGELGRYHIRVAGHCGCPPPHHWSEGGMNQPYVSSYHIDNDEALEIFKLYAKASLSWNWNPRFVPHDDTWTIRKEYTKRVDGDKFVGWSIR